MKLQIKKGTWNVSRLEDENKEKKCFNVRGIFFLTHAHANMTVSQ